MCILMLVQETSAEGGAEKDDGEEEQRGTDSGEETYTQKEFNR